MQEFEWGFNNLDGNIKECTQYIEDLNKAGNDNRKEKGFLNKIINIKQRLNNALYLWAQSMETQTGHFDYWIPTGHGTFKKSIPSKLISIEWLERNPVLFLELWFPGLFIQRGNLP
uniref:Uncharacterized protein n=1 Tax=Romanomermis culicivorax TaxID=13658 RepID=A0A915JQT5_ROMCU